MNYGNPSVDRSRSSFSEGSEQRIFVAKIDNFESFFKQASDFQDNNYSKKEDILNSSSSIALEAKLESPDSSVNILNFIKGLASNTWQKTKNLLAETAPQLSLADHLIIFEELEARLVDAGYEEIDQLQSDFQDISLHRPVNFAGSSYFDNSKKEKSFKYALHLSYLDNKIILRPREKIALKERAKLKLSFRKFKNLANTKSHYPIDRAYLKVNEILDNAPMVMTQSLQEVLGEARPFVETQKVLNKPFNLNFSDRLADLDATILPFKNNFVSSEIKSPQAEVNIDFDLLEAAIAQVKQKYSYENLSSFIKTKKDYIYLPYKYFQNLYQSGKIISLLESRFAEFSDLAIQQKKQLIDVLHSYSRELYAIAVSQAIGIKSGFLVKVEDLIHLKNILFAKSKIYLNNHFKSLQYVGYFSGILILSLGVFNAIGPSLHKQLNSNYLINVFDNKNLDRIIVGLPFSKERPTPIHHKKLKPMKSADNPLWVSIPNRNYNSDNDRVIEPKQRTEASLNVISDALNSPHKILNSTEMFVDAEKSQNKSSLNVALNLLRNKQNPGDISQAIQLIEDLANKNYPPAQLQMGKILYKGAIIKKDSQRARRLILQSAEAGYSPAMYELGVMQSAMGSKEQKNAVNWFLKAAHYGVVDSQYNLGIIYLKGLGVKQDLKESYKWFAIAASQGDVESLAKRDEIKTHLLLEEIDEAQEFASTFKPSVSD